MALPPMMMSQAWDDAGTAGEAEDNPSIEGISADRASDGLA